MSISLVYEHPNTVIKDYLTDCMRLISSIRIKCHDAAKLAADLDLENGISVDKELPSTWRYYKEMLGVGTGSTIEVKSLDKRQDIFFTREMLAGHPKTRDAYRAGTVLLRDLLDTHTHEQSLIMGNLYPAYSSKYPTTDSLYQAPDFTIVAHDTELVEPHEDELMSTLQEALYRFCTRNYNKFYTPSNRLYLPGFYAIITQFLLTKLLAIRQENCKTMKVHSFHLKMYLAGFYQLDRYLPYMTRKQALFLYRNIEYLSRNVGKSEIFHLLKDELLTSRNIPLSRMSVRHAGDIDDNGVTDLRVRSTPINSVANMATEYLTMDDLARIESADSEPNKLFYEEEARRVKEDFAFTLSSVTQTKLHMSVVYDLTNLFERNRDETYLRQWVAWSFQSETGEGPYYEPDVIVSYTDPRDGVLYEIDPKVAFTYMLLLHNKRNGVEYESLLRIENFDHYATTCPTLEECLYGVMDTTTNRAFAQDLIDRFVYVDVVTSPAQFSTLADEIFNFDVYAQRKIHSDASPDIQSQLRTVLSRFYKRDNYRYSMGSDTLVSAFLSDNGIREDLEMTNEQYGDLMDSLMKSSTGYYEDEYTKLSNVQKAMIKVFGILSSYTTKFIMDTNEQDIVAINVGVPSIENKIVYVTNVVQDAFVGIDDLELVLHGAVEVFPMEMASPEYSDIRVNDRVLFQMDINNGDVGYFDGMNIDMHVNSMAPEQLLTPTTVEVQYPGMDETVMEEFGVIGYELFEALSEEDKRSLKFPS